MPDKRGDDQVTTTLPGTAGRPPEGAGDRDRETAPEGSLAAHLERSDRGEEERLGPERYADGIGGLARSLAELHERGIVHGGVRPQSISIDSQTGHLGLPPPALGDEGVPPPVGDPYVAPEQHLGEEGPSIDQYALGVLARDVFTARSAPPATAPLQETLRQATAPLPEDRHPDVARFGEALADAVRREAPYGLADRLAARSPRVRACLAPAGLMAAIILAIALDDARDPLTGPLFTAVFAPLVAGALAFFAGLLVWLAAAIRRPRWPSLDPVQPPGVPLVAVAVIFAVILRGGGSLTGSAFNVIVGVYGARALLAPPAENSGRWLIRLLRRWDLRRTLSPLRRRAVTAGFSAAVLGVLLAPVAVGVLWPIPFEFPTAPAREYPPVVAVANFRGTIGKGDYDYACRKLMTVEAAAPARECPDVVAWAATVLRNDPAIRAGRQVLGMRRSLDRFQVRELPHPAGGRFWMILAPDRQGQAGAMYTVGGSERRIVVMLSRDPPRPGDFHSMWFYEVVKRQGLWRVDEYRACDVGLPGSGHRDAKCLARNGLPGARARALLARVGTGRR